MFSIPLEWFNKSQRNICFVRYPIESDPDYAYEIFKELATQRLYVMAKIIGQFIMAVHYKNIERKHYRGVLDMSHFEINGFSMGAQIGTHVCRYVSHRSNGAKVKFLLGTEFNSYTYQIHNSKFIR